MAIYDSVSFDLTKMDLSKRARARIVDGRFCMIHRNTCIDRTKILDIDEGIVFLFIY